MEMKIKDHWDRLSPGTQRWLTDNPGCLILPRTMTEEICQETGVRVDCDEHGQAMLSQEDLDFIRAKAEESQTPPPEHRFFDATQPGEGT
jgi:alanyl-tRNA synthetase